MTVIQNKGIEPYEDIEKVVKQMKEFMSSDRECLQKLIDISKVYIVHKDSFLYCKYA
jgi:hypothetical protein